MEIGRWYYSLIDKIGPLLVGCGATWLMDHCGDHKPEPVDPKELQIVRSFIADGSVQLTKEWLGNNPDYWDYLFDDLKPQGEVWYRRKFPIYR